MRQAFEPVETFDLDAGLRLAKSDRPAHPVESRQCDEHQSDDNAGNPGQQPLMEELIAAPLRLLESCSLIIRDCYASLQLVQLLQKFLFSD